MTILAMDGFDMYNGIGANTGLGAKWPLGGGSQRAMILGRFGGQAVQVAPSGFTEGWFQQVFGTSSATMGMGAAMRITAFQTTTASFHILFFNDTTPTVGLVVRATGAIEAFLATSTSGAGTSLGISATGVILLNTWHFVEVAVTISDTVGSVLVKVDGATVLTITGVDTNNGVGTVNSVGLGPTNSSSGSAYGIANWDDFYLTDGATLGERRVETLRPAADTATKNFTPLSGTSNFAMVDETLVDGDTTYVQSSTVGARDLYTLGPLSSTPATIDAVQVVSFAEKTDATTRSLYNSVQSAGTDSDGSAFNLAASYARFDRLLANDPNGGGTWTPSRVNGLFVGPKLAA